jgi:arabinogalactan oligomer/maltooligosaccharide transport system permease protein
MNDLEYLKMGKWGQKLYDLRQFFVKLPGRFVGGIQNLIMMVVNLVKAFGAEIADIADTFIHGDWKTKISFVVMGFGSFCRGQYFRGILFFLFQTVFNMYMLFFGGAYISKMGTLGTLETYREGRKTVYGDNSFLILLYGILSLFFVLAFIYTWRVNVKQNKVSEEILRSGKKLKCAKDDLASLVDAQFHKTLLALPTLGIFVFTIVPTN